MNKNHDFSVTKCAVLCCLMALFQWSFAGYSQSITYHGENKPLHHVLQAIKQQTDYEVLGSKTLIDNAKPVSIQAQGMPLIEFLGLVLQDQQLTYRMVEKTIMLEFHPTQPGNSTPRQAQQQRITGIVLGKDQLPLAGATIAVKGGRTVTSDKEGRFTLQGIPEDKTITISFVGYEKTVIKIRDGETDYTVVLIEESKEMDEVVVTGYQIINRDTYTGTAVTKTGEELQQVNPQNILQAIQVFDPSFRLAENNLAGSNPNALPNITVRGSSALPAGTDSDVLRRDNITSTVNLPAFILDGYEVNVQKILDLDMNRVASVTLLKDAAATAVYGSRAANGVMVITTKAPKDGKLRVTYSHETNINGPDLSDYQVLNAAEKLEYELLAGLYEATTENSLPQDMLDQMYYRRKAYVVGGVDTYWLSQPVRTAVGQKHGLFVEGGSEVFRYGVDLRYQTRPGVMRGSHRNQYSGSMNFSYSPNSKIRFQNELAITVVDAQESPYGSFAEYVRMNPYYRMADDHGNIVQVPDMWDRYSSSEGVVSDNILNPLYNATLSSFNRTGYNEIIDNLSGEFELASGLRLRGQLSFTKRLHQLDDYRSPLANEFYHYEASRTDEKGSYTSGNIDELFWDGNVRLNYIKQIDDHNINFVAGANIRTERMDERSFIAIGFPNDRFSSVGFARGYAEDASPRSTLDESRLFGVFASTNYAFRNRYLLDATIRTDGSSKFGSNNRTAPFWSFGLGWNVHQEPWFQSNVVSLLRLRFTTGLTGSVQFSPYMSRTTYEYQQENWYSSGIGAIVSNFGNNNLSWQKTQNSDIGFDLGLFHDRLMLTPRIYRRLTRDILADISIAPSSGFSSYKENLGDMENRGAELNLSWTAVSNPTWTVTLMGNFAHNTNKIVRISNALKAYNDRVNDAQQQVPETDDDEDLRGVPLLRYNEGQSVDAIYAVPSLGIDPENGREIYVKRDGSLTYDWDARDITVVGNATPKATGSFGGTVRYKQFMVVAYFQTRFGGDLYNQTLVDRVENADPRYNVDHRVFEEKWQQSGDHTFYKNIADLGETRVSSRFIMPDNVLTLQSVFLSYDVDQTLATKLSLSRLRVGLTANDLFRWSSVALERGINYPFARSVTLSLQAAF
ncbi:SusC/RagA family TonB-linked outer membrane protein [Parapedobacter tibetensis]|uniref:SusC/RagA family TonB-linked outer membrane protein n=1 Tax=Parapedobacter tibetensis TaxID=2972951 RepID=UPI00214D7943|nr:SusC/RagA family TonB-linked outer membrane protein [Parapedobacter tibetensis]